MYVGKHMTENLDDGYMGSGKYLNNAIKLYGLENFHKEILFVFDNEEEMNKMEAEIVNEEFLMRDDVYNLCLGGQGGFSHINKNRLNVVSGESLEQKKKKLTESQSNVLSDPVNKAKLINGIKAGHSQGKYKYDTFRGKTHSEEWRKQHSETMKVKSAGSNNSQFGSIWITDGSNARKISKTDAIPEGWKRGRKA
jgi:hypothetical protein